MNLSPAQIALLQQAVDTYRLAPAAIPATAADMQTALDTVKAQPA